ncbi:extracellular calcium-sensing receptor-like [Xenopus laevis]|uniref:Extracellular calcium-sensing receptor-like n=1 Tax=Xenopus laevis TaxID=8355 RepID=A0A8J1MIM8_XENLA|nr:extracellular calcium-sensing receptor-like [Xenopus laevis]
MHCQKIATEYYQSMHALIFAVEEINGDHELLPNITLGFQIFDKCTTLRRSAKGVLLMLSGGKKMTPNYHCYREAPLAGIVGDSGSTHSILMAEILGLYRYPQISYLSTSPVLSDRNRFPSFFRTIPSDEVQMRGLAQLVSYFDWSWVGFLADDDDYGQFGLQMAKQEIIRTGACVAFSENILIGQPNRNAPQLAKVIRESSAKVVVVIASDHNFVILVEELLKENVTDKIWVASEGWVTSALLSEEKFQVVLVGTIGFAIHGAKMPEFTKYFQRLHPLKDFHDPFIEEFWEQTFSCTLLNQNNLFQLNSNSTIQACTRNEKLESLLTENYHRIPLNVYTAVYSIAWALQGLLNCVQRTEPFHYGGCSSIISFHPWQLLYYIQNLNVKTRLGNQIVFDDKGNPPAIYDIVNWHVSTNGTLEQVVVGSYDLSASDGNTLKINSPDITWIDSKTQVPVSKCSPSCPSGFRQMIVPGKPSCCYECARCPQGQISNRTGFIGYPQPENCLLRQMAFGLAFAFCISCVLAKTITVIIAFNATKPGSRLKQWIGLKVSYCVIVFCVFNQFCMCVMWLIFSPPFPELDTNTKPGIIIVYCNEGSTPAFWCMLGYLGLLATISFIVAFLARRLPDSFNEAKFITFSMLAFLSVWVSFIPAYLSARGMYTVAMEVFAILSSTWAVVICIFMPKMFMVLFRPHLNSREHIIRN